jgi:probable rRNA maturation factor
MNDDPYYFVIQGSEISIDDEAWLAVDGLQGAVKKVLDRSEFHSHSVSILLTNDNHIQHLNHDFRGIEKPTNVLSFPSDEDEDSLGDIAISINTLKREAEQEDKDFIHHFIHLLVHGLLHLKNYDHETDEEAEEMESLEIKILQDMGIKNPYIEKN